MGSEYTKAQKKASLTYQKNMKHIKAWVTPEQHAAYKTHAQKRGMPLGTLITNLLDKDMKEAE